MDHKAVYYFFLVLTVFAAFWRGARSERWGAATALVASSATTIAALNPDWGSLVIEMLVIDLIVLASFWRLALQSHRYWPYWVTGWQLVGVLVHIQRALFTDILPAPYALMSMYLAYPMLLLILFASMRAGQSRQAVAA
jgi:hypothetical protein